MQISARPTLVDTLIPGQGILRDVALMVGFSLLVALFAQIAVKLPFTTVPITGQTLGVLMTGGALGARRGAGSMGFYMVWGMVGIPVFAPSASNIQGELIHFILPWAGNGDLVWNMTSGGYIVGFIVAAFLVGQLAERGWDRGSRVLVAMLIGNLSIYFFGLGWLAYTISSGVLDPSLGFSLAEVIPGEGTLDKTLVGGLYPFIIGDLLKLIVAALALPGIWALIGQNRGQR